MNAQRENAIINVPLSGLKRLSIVILLIICSLQGLYAQAPQWVPGTPSVASTGPTSITLNYGIDRVGTVYIIVFNFNNTTAYTSASVRSQAIAGVNYPRVATAIIPVISGNENSILQAILYVTQSLRLHTIYIVAENSSGTLQASPVRLTATTLACPQIDILTGLSQPRVCVTEGATATFNVFIMDPANSGILKGTEWTIDWGDGSTTSYTSVADNDIPPLALRRHTYTSVTNCNYVFSNSIRNPCGETRSVQYVAVVHGRDIPSDGDGELRIVDNATGSSNIQVCEGTETVITLRDNSTWNCQNPVLPGGLVAVPNSDPRNIEWLYGRDPSGNIQNTINGTVYVGALPAPQASGRISPVPYGPTSLSQSITIPATARAGQYFRVYLKNWNKCNWTDPDFVSTYVDIVVIAAPPAPTAPSRTVCFGSDRTLSVTSTPVGTITWYRDAALTQVLGTGTTFVPSETAVGTYTYYVTDRSTTGLRCQSAPTTVTLTINPIPLKPSISHPNKNDICYDGGITTYTMTAVPVQPPAVTRYQWFKDGVPIPGETSATIVISQPSHTGSYTVAAVGIAPSYCMGPQSDPWYVTVHTLSNLTNPVPVTICQNQTAVFSAFTTDEVQNWQWEVSTNGGASFSTVGNAPPYSGFNTNTLTITNPPPSFNGYLYRVEIKTPPGQGGCPFKSQSAMLTVDALPTANAGPAIARCSDTPLDPIYMTGATAGGTYSSAVWTGGGTMGFWTQNENPALAYFTPTRTSGTFTARLTVTGSAACGSVTVSRTRTVSWSQTPTVEAGPDISRCDANPLAAILMTGASAGGRYSTITWSGGDGLGTWTQNSNPANARFTPSVPSGTFVATLTATGRDGCTGYNPTDTRVITWGQTPVVDAGPDISRCDATPRAPIAMAGASATGTFTNQTWAGGAGLGTWTQNANPSLATFTPSVDVGSFTATLSVTGNGACTGSNASDTRVIEWSYAATVNAGPDQSICATSTVTLAGSIGGSATSATWTGGTGTFNPNNTTLNAVYTPSLAERAAQSVTLTLTTDDPPGVCLPVSDQVTIAIGTMPTSAVLTTSGDACSGVAPSWLNIVINGGAPPYRISYLLNGSVRPDITNYYSGNNHNLGLLPVGSYTYQITQIRDACNNILTGAGLPGPQTIQIFQNPVANAGADQALCGVLSVALSAIPSVGTGTWSVVSGPGTVNFNPGVNDPSATITVSDYGTYVLRWTEVNGGICTSFSEKTVQFERTASAGLPQNLCGTLSATMAGNSPVVGTGTWSKVSGPGDVTFTPNANLPGATATVTQYGTYVLRWTISNSGFCSTSSDVTIVYNPAGQVNQPPDMVFCNGQVAPSYTFTTSNTGGTTTYVWSNNNTSIGLASSGPGNLPSFTASNPGTAPITATITVTPTYTNGPTVCPGTPKTFTITVNPTGQVDQPQNRIVCENSEVNVTFVTQNTPVAATTFNWTNDNTNIGLGSSGTGNITFTALNNSTRPLTGTITVTPVYSNGGVSCSGPSRSFTITVNPEGQVNIPSDLSVCNGAPTVITFTTNNTDGSTSYSWTNSNTSIGLLAGGTGSTISFTPSNSGTAPVSALITVTPTFSNGSVDCQGPSQSFTITVNPTPVLSSPLTIPDICSNSAVIYNPFSATAGTTFSWVRNDVAGITPAGPVNGTDGVNEILRNRTNTTIGVTYRYTLTANECSNQQNVVVNVKPEPVIAPDQSTDVCSGVMVDYHINLTNFSNPGDNVTFRWGAPVLVPVSPDFTGGTARESALPNNITDLFYNRTGVTGTATYTITPYKDGCAGEPQTVVIYVNPQPVLDPNLNTIVCSNSPSGLILKEAPGSVTATYFIVTNVTIEDGLSPLPGNAVINGLPSPANYLAGDRYLNITGVNKNVTYSVRPANGTTGCIGDARDVVVTIRPQPYIAPGQVKTVCSGIPVGMEILLQPANTPSGTLFSWPKPDMSDNSDQGTAGTNVPADPAGKVHIDDILYNYSPSPITATYFVTPVSSENCPGAEIPVVITVNPEPVPKTISGRDKICVGEINLVYSVPSTFGSSFHWTVDPGVGLKTFDYNTSAIIINAANAPGSGNITVYETNSYGCDGDPSMLNVQVYTQVSPENISGPIDVCANSTHSYQVGARAGSVYKWSIPGGAAIIGDPSAASITVVFGNVGGTISVTETNIASCVTNHNPLAVNVKPLPTAIISGGGTICEGSPLNLTVDFTGTAPYTFTYAINGVAQSPPISTSDDPYMLAITQAGTYTIVNVTDATNCTNSGFGSAFVTFYPRPTGTISGGDELCQGESTTLTFVFSGTPPFTFTYTDGTTPLTVPNYPNSLYNISVTPSASATYILSALTDGNGCNGALSGSASIVVNIPPALTFNTTNLTCYGNNTGAIDLSVTGNGPFGFSWTGPGGFAANSEDISGLAAGTYNITVTDTKGCISTGSVTITEPEPMNAHLESTNIFCYGAAEGTITISSPVGGSGFYEYTIDGGQNWETSGNFTGLNPGVYDVRMRDIMNPSCFRILNAALVLTGPDELKATVTATSIVCYGANNGSIIISNPTGGFGTYNYSIDGGLNWQGSGNFVNLRPGIYDVRMRDGLYQSCEVILNPSVEITEPPQLTATVSSTNVTCFGASDGTITISDAAGGHNRYEYSINGGGSWQSSGVYTNLSPGTYNVQIRDADYTFCFRVLNPVLLISQPPVLRATVTWSMVTCNGANDGTITISGATGGSGSYEYTINGGSDWSDITTRTNLPPGTYDVRIRDAMNHSCEIILNSGVIITEPPVLSGTVIKTDITCNGADDGRITIANPLGGYGTYEFSNDGGNSWQVSNVFSDLSPGTYNIQMRDRLRTGCVLIFGDFEILEPEALTATLQSTNVTCYNARNGTITISVAAGGSGTYQYTINGGASWQGSGDFIYLQPGPYDVRLRDALNPGCYLILNPNLVITEPAELNATLASTNITCFGAADGTITITFPEGGYGNYEYTINGGGSWQSTGSYTNLGPGNYSVAIRDADQPACIKILNNSLNISQPGLLNAVVTPTMITCYGANDGAINITSPTGGYGTYEYSINGGLDWDLSGSFSPLSPGVYDVRIRDASYPDCVIILNSSLRITEPAELSATVQSTNITCNGANNGTITISLPTGGYGTYDFSTDGGSTWQTNGLFTGLRPGTYDVVIRDRAHPLCMKTLVDNLAITEPELLTATVTSTNITCFGANNGTITISFPAGGYGRYEYSIDGGITWQSSGLFTGLIPSSYNVLIRDADNILCTRVLVPSLQITQPDALSASVSSTNVTCFNASDGTITISSPQGGSGSYEYSIDGGTSWHQDGNFTLLAPGFYNVQMRDILNPDCIRILNSSLRITEPAILNATVTKFDITCFGEDNGRILITLPTGGYGNYEYRITESAVWQNSGDFTGLTAGTYVVQIRDADNPGCARTLNPALTITEPAQLSATAEWTNITCHGANNGTITITNTAGGYGTYQYTINGIQWFNSGYFTSLTSGIYNVQIRDAANPSCVAVINPALEITEPEELNATLTSTNITCFGGSDGTISISDPEGGYGNYEFTINGGGSWQSSGVYTGLGPGTYNVQMRDADNTSCIKVLNSSLSVTQPAMLRASVTKTDVSCNGNNDGTITISSPAGGYGTYQYSIDGGLTWQDSGDYTGRTPGMYDVRIRDASNINCYVILNPSLVITEPSVLTISTSGDILLDCYDDHDGTGTFYAYGGTMPYYFTVESNSTGAIIPPAFFNSLLFYNAGAGSITVLVTDNNGCTARATINISQPDVLTPGSIGTNQVICYGGTPETITELTAPSGGPGNYRYQWQYSADPGGPFMNIPFADQKDYTPPANASYTFYYRRMVTSGVCLPVYSNIVEIRVNPLPIAILSGGETICPGEISVLRVNMLSGTGPFTVEIDGLGTVSDYNSGDPIEVIPASTTTYRLVRVTDANNCSVTSPSPNLTGTATVTVSLLPSITSITPSQSVCEYTMVRLSVVTEGTNLEYQWYVDDGNGPEAVTDGGTYYGAITPNLTILSATRDLNGNRYYAIVSGCGVSVTSDASVLTVDIPAEITLAPSDVTICTGQSAVFEADASGSSLEWQWYVNMGTGFVPATDNEYISGSRTRILTITNAQSSFNNWVFRAVAAGVCGAPAGTNLAILKVINPPAVTLNPVSVPVCENGSVTFTANGTGYQSMRWQVLLAGNWTDLTDNETYIGTNTQLLAVMNAGVTLNGNQYRLALTGACATTYSEPATLTVNANPVVDFSAVSPLNACGGVPIVLDGNPQGGSGAYTQHRWTGDIGPLSSYIIQTPNFLSVIPGEFNLNYRVTDSNGCSGNGDTKVIVDSPSAQFTQDATFGCTPLQVTFTKDMAGFTRWEWNFGDGSPVDQVSSNPVHTFISTQPGSIEFFEVKLRVETAGGCTDEYSSFITVYPAVDATFTPDATVVCSGDIVTFTAQPGAGRYFWDYGDNVSGYSTNVATHLYTNFTSDPLTITVRLTTTSFFNCTDTKTYNITVMPVPVPQFTADPVLQVFTPPGSQVNFTNQTNPGNWSWLWKFGDNTTSTEMNPVHTYTSVGTYYVSLIAGNEYCSDSIMHYINIVPPAPVANFDSIPSGCAPLDVTFNNTSLNTDVPGTVYYWNFGDGSTSTAKNPTYTYLTPGDYKVELVVTGPGGTSRKNQMVHAYPSPRAYFEVAPNFVYVNDESVRCFNLSQGADTYLWDFGDGDTSTLKEPYHKYMLEGVYDITLWAYSDNGCSDMYKLSPAVTVEPLGELRFPSVFTPNKDGPIERTDLPTGGVEVDQFFYPPIRQKVMEYKLQIFNRWGVLIFESDKINVPWNGYYNNELCPQGVYVWYVEGKFADGKPFKMVGNVTLLH